MDAGDSQPPPTPPGPTRRWPRVTLHPPPAPPARRRRPPARLLVVAAVGLAWAATIAGLWRSEALEAAGSTDVRELVEAAGFSRRHASATHAIRIGSLEVGRLTSTVSGGEASEQVAYVLRGRLDQPYAVDLRGFVIADWNRRPERFAFEARLGGQAHRLDGGIVPGPGGTAALHAHASPAGPEGRRWDLDLPEAPVLIPGPLPLPELPGLLGEGPGPRRGSIVDPLTGEPVAWTVETAGPETLAVAGGMRPALRHVVTYGPHVITLWTEPTGFPLKAELPLGIVVVLVEESR